MRTEGMELINETRYNEDVLETLVSFLDASQMDGVIEGELSKKVHALEKRIVQEARFFRKFADKMPGGFFIYHADEKEEIIYANETMLQIFNCSTMEEFREHTGNSFRGIVHPDDLEEVEKSIREQIAISHFDLDYVEYRIIQKGGQIRWLEDYGHFVHNEKIGDIFYVFVGDATEKRERWMTKANSARTLFLSNMSHDIKTPMNAIINFTSLAQNNLDDKEKLSRYLELISESSSQLMQLLNDVLEISRVESGEVSIEEEECNLQNLMQKVQSSLLSRAADKEMSVSLDISRLRHKTVYADKHKLRLVFSYLTDNALKYTKNGGRITIALSEREEKKGASEYCFVVEDNGIGMGREFLQHLFEPFEREKNTTLSGIYGTGLGMTVTKNLVELMGGTIEASSIVGEGSWFTVRIPFRWVQDCMAAAGLEDGKEVKKRKSGAKRILIVDDNEINLEIENEVLKQAEFLVETATDGSIAVEKVKQSKPGYYDLILMDIQMPVMDGYDATRVIREIENPALAGIPIIAVSANTFEEDRRMAIESGMNAHLGKPLEPPKLYKMIEKFFKE